MLVHINVIPSHGALPVMTGFPVMDNKIKYGLAKEPEDIDRLDKAFNGLMGAIPEKLTVADKKRIKSYINKLSSLPGKK